MKDVPQILSEIKKQPPDRQLTLGDLSNFKEIEYRYLKDNVPALELMIKYCKNRNKPNKYLFF